MASGYETLMERVRDIGRLHAVAQLLGWDQETYMPKKGVAARAEQTALLAGMAHQQLVSDEVRRLLDEVNVPADDPVAATNVRETRRVFERAVRLPTELVKSIAHTSSLAKEAWSRSRDESAFNVFEPLFGQLLDLKKQVAERIGYETEPYDALMDEYEPGARSAEIASVFAALRDESVALLQRVTAASDQPDPSILTREYPVEQQRVLCRRMAEALHFDFDAGRADVSVHPFCTTIGGSGDVRITTRYQERFLPGALFGTLHETGHALYEQGLPFEHRFTPMAEPVSLGIHESQSRLWENFVGRSRAFWAFHFEPLRELFPDALRDVSLESFYRAINTVRPSLIRVEADELTYNLHIVLRFELERALFNGELSIGEMPAAWNETMAKSLGITPENDAEGCLQDIHWSMGAFGYFPTYTLGNLYAAQFFEQARKDIPALDERIAANDHRPLLDWLREKIHQHGQRYRAGELVERVTGQPLTAEAFIRHVTSKFSAVYGLS